MSPLPPLKTVFGFINRGGLNSYPAPLITLVTMDDSNVVHAVYPTGAVVRLKEEGSGLPLLKEKAMLRESFIAPTIPLQSIDAVALTSFALAANNIVVGTPEEILQHLDDAVICDQYTGEDLERLKEAHKSWTAFVADRKISL